MENLGYYNGRYDLIERMTVPMNDRVCYFGDGVYDATYSHNYNIFALDEHIDRIYNSAALLRIEIAQTKQEMKDILNEDFIAQYGRPDVIITDPPRAGMHEDVINTILFAEPKRIVYVSCNPATQARDLNMLDRKYRVVKVQPVDMFPHTHHVENVVLLEKR